MGRTTSHRGFTILELMIAVGIIALMAAMVIVIIDPKKQLSEARNAVRRADVNIILNAVETYARDHGGSLPETITTSETEICRIEKGIDCTGLIDLRTLSGTYVLTLPIDPSTMTGASTSYTIFRTGQNVIVGAPLAEKGMTIRTGR